MQKLNGLCAYFLRKSIFELTNAATVAKEMTEEYPNMVGALQRIQRDVEKLLRDVD